MLLRVNVCLKRLSILGKEYKWTKPSHCPRCQNSRLWGHGFVAKCFRSFSQKLWLKRYRCCQCGMVLTIHPQGFWPRFQANIQHIYFILRHRLTRFHWPKSSSRQRAGHWLQSFLSLLRMLNGQNNSISPSNSLTDLYHRQVCFLA